jgi:hypothetical protein
MAEETTGMTTALAVTHPSHELRVYGWLERSRPRILVFTDGSGRGGRPRLPSSIRGLEKLGIARGPVFGAVTDLAVYSALLHRDTEFFLRWALIVAEDLARSRVTLVAGDAAEGHNSAHDVWRGVVDAAVDIALERHGWSTASYSFALFGHPTACPEGAREKAIWVRLDDTEFARKVNAVRDYSPKLAAEVDAILAGALFEGLNRFSEPALALAAASEAGLGLDTLVQFPELYSRIREVVDGIKMDDFRTECLWPTRPFEYLARDPGKPFYEFYGERLVAAGQYREVIRYRDHVAPVLEGLQDWRRARSISRSFPCQ